MERPTFGPPTDLGEIDPLKFVVSALEEAVLIIHQQNSKQGILHLAAKHNCINLIKGYIRNADVNCRDTESTEEKTPLHYAIEYGHNEVAEYLINFEADLYSVDWLGRTPIHYAAWFAKDDTIVNQMIALNVVWGIKDNDGVTPIMLAKQPAIAEKILGTSESFMLPDDFEGNSVLHHAASDYNLAMVEFWLEKGQNPRSINNQGQTPWEYLLWSDQLTNISNQDKAKFLQIGDGETYEDILQIQKLLE